MSGDATTRRLAVLAYLLQAGAGLVLLPSVMGEQLGPAWAVLCCWLAGGGVLAAAGQLRRRLVGELVGLPLLSSAFAAFAGLQTLLQLDAGLPALAVGNGALLLAVAALLHQRWRDVRRLLDASEQGGRP